MKYTIGIKFAWLVIILVLCSCNSHTQQGENTTDSKVSDTSNKVFEFPIKKFSLPYNTPLRLDANSLVYMKQVPFDTSYLLHINKQGSKARGVCYLVLPTYHRDLEDFYDEDHELLFFEGFSFNLDAKQWDMLKKETDEAILNMPDSVRSSSQCLHCPSYSLYYNNQERSTGNSKLQENFKVYNAFIRDSLIDPLLANRNLKMKNE